MSDSAAGLPEQALLAIWEKHRPDVLERVSLIERAAAALIADGLGEALLRESQRAVHTLAGSVGTFGFARASRTARELELKLLHPAPADAPDIYALIATLRDELAGEASTSQERPPAEPSDDLPDAIPRPAREQRRPAARKLLGDESAMLEAMRALRAQAETDSLTGLANRGKSGEELARFVSLAERFSQSLSVAMLDLDRFKQVNDTYGHAAGDSVLRRLGEHLRRDFRDQDLVGRWGGEEFIVAMYGMTREDGARRLTGTLERFCEEQFAGSWGAFRVSFSAGVAVYPHDGADADAVCAAADATLYRAKAAGRARVLAAGGEQRAEQCDIVCVEDDEALAELLLTSLMGSGYTARRFGDGEQARQALCGSQPTLSCRVILLDVDLPGLDGHSLLAQLAADGILRSTRAIMLTTRAGETDTLKAFDLGVFDHVAKPFSLPVLLRRVQNAMQT
jgi:diguanylate cyclase (GGDEF)-like protein